MNSEISMALTALVFLGFFTWTVFWLGRTESVMLELLAFLEPPGNERGRAITRAEMMIALLREPRMAAPLAALRFAAEQPRPTGSATEVKT